MNLTSRSFLSASVLMALATAVPSPPANGRKPERIRGLFAGPKIQPGRAKVGRNEPCPCGSGKKFKACHLTGKVADVAVKTSKQLAVS